MSTKSSESVKLEGLRRAVKNYSQPHAVNFVLYEVEQLEEKLTTRNRLLEAIKAATQQLRLDIKYLVFDLQATRAERDEYKQRLKDAGLL